MRVFARGLRSGFCYERGVSTDSLSTLRLGQVLRGKYLLERVLGVGGMATVYAATHRNRRRFAVKILHPELSAHAEIRSRFQREGYVANSVGHRGAVAVLDDDVADDGSAFLVMELLEGMNVEELSEKSAQNLSVRAVLAIADQLLDVLSTAHENGIIHRDIKPANLFLTRDGVLKVLDFGIARLRDSASSSMTQTGMAMGTPAFMSPEQARGQSSELDLQADLWSVAATLFTLLSGQLVHEGDNAQMLLVAALTQPARSLASVAPSLPQALTRVIDRALRFDKAERYQNARALREALREAERATLGAVEESNGQQTLAELLKTQRPQDSAVVESQATLSDAPAKSPALRWLVLSAAGLCLLALTVLLTLRLSSSRVNERTVETAAPPLPEPSADTKPASADGSAGAAREPAISSPTRRERSVPGVDGVNPRAASGRRTQPTAQPAKSGATSTLCARLLERQGVGDLLSSQESSFFAQNCRN